MSKRKTSLIIAGILLLSLLSVPLVLAQSYRFSLDENISHVYINQDGSVDVEYWLTFTCQPGAHAIDIVDIGMPNGHYVLDSAVADIGGVQLTDIRPSEYVKPGVEVHLSYDSIKPGKQGTLHFRINVGHMVYRDSEDADYASVEFSPTWFGSQYVTGTTHQEVHFHFPPGVTGDETKWHYREFTSWDTVDDRLVFTWVNPNARGDQQTMYGVSFPKRYVDTIYSVDWAKALAPLRGSIDFLGTNVFGWIASLLCFVAGVYVLVQARVLPPIKLRSGLAALLLQVVVALLAIGFIAPGFLKDFKFCFPLLALLLPIALVLWPISGWVGRQNRMNYLPPTMSIEGVGVKRGLTAVEASILLQMPLDRVLTMILFGLLKKGAVDITSQDPLRLERLKGDIKGLHDYEKRFMVAIAPDGHVHESKLQHAVVALIKSVNNKMRGFSRRETVAYYQDIVARAWQQVKEAETPEVKAQRFDDEFEWAMLDRDFDERTEEVFQEEDVPVPDWLERHIQDSDASRPPRPRPSAAPSARQPASARGKRAPLRLPTLPGATFANRLATQVEGMAAGLVSNVERFVSGVSRETNPPPVRKPLELGWDAPKGGGGGRRSGGGGGGWSGGGGGGGCACACACAGCACACAGGGR
jgi:hypothetical protein